MKNRKKSHQKTNQNVEEKREENGNSQVLVLTIKLHMKRKANLRGEEIENIKNKKKALLIKSLLRFKRRKENKI